MFLGTCSSKILSENYVKISNEPPIWTLRVLAHFEVWSISASTLCLVCVLDSTLLKPDSIMSNMSLLPLTLKIQVHWVHVFLLYIPKNPHKKTDRPINICLSARARALLASQVTLLLPPRIFSLCSKERKGKMLCVFVCSSLEKALTSNHVSLLELSTKHSSGMNL